MEFRDQGYIVDLCSDGNDALFHIQNWIYDAVILDIMLPGIDGVSLLRQLRHEQSNTPVLMLSAKNEVDTKVDCLDKGADDYLPKPFSAKELHARVKAMLRRPILGHKESIVLDERGDVVLYPENKLVKLKGEEVELTRQEYAILFTLAKSADRVLSKDYLRERIAEDDGASNLVEVLIYNLRKKLGKHLIVTKRGLGYLIPK